MKQVTVKMSGQQYGRLADEAERRGTTIAGCIRDLLSEHVNQAELIAELVKVLGEIRSVQVVGLATTFAAAKGLDFARDVGPQIQIISDAWLEIIQAGNLEADRG